MVGRKELCMEVECDIGEGKVEHGMVGLAEGAKVNVLKEKVRKGNVVKGKLNIKMNIK